jgi:gamma-glutamyltranspeptidase/glutathione hydrolase
MEDRFHRRELGRRVGAALVGGAVIAAAPGERKGCVVGQPQGARAGEEVLAAGGNAVDAAVAAALVAGVVALPSCGIGGYGGHLVIARADGRKVTAIDFNSAAPAAARPDLFPLDDQGRVKGGANAHGWLAAGVPGTLAGLQLALDRYGTQPFRKLVQPALRYARDGFTVSAGLAAAVQRARRQLARDPVAARLLLPGGEPPKAGDTFRNPDLAALLQELAEAGSVEPFYRGAPARRIAAAFQKHGGLVTADDLAAYRAREVEPLALKWRGFSVHTAPLTAGGATVLEALAVLKALGWKRRPADAPETLLTRVEALRLVWHDRLRYFGDPEKVKVPLDRLLSEAHARRLAGRVEAAVRAGKPAAAEGAARPAGGTIHLSAADTEGNLVALTLTHGDGFGAQVAVEGMGLLLGQGMSRFEPRPGHPNSVGPGKRPLHNMRPTVVLHDRRPVLALGATGGRKIPNAVLDVLPHYVGRGTSLADTVAAPRLNTQGDLVVQAEARWPAAALAPLKKFGYTVQTSGAATVQAVEVEPGGRTCRTASR